MGENSLLLLTSFARALAHKIRTPLSVAANELSALSAAHPEDCKLASARITEISAMLKDACKAGSGELKRESMLVKPLLAPHFEVDPSVSESLAVHADKNLLQCTVETVRGLFDRHGDTAKPRVTAERAKDGAVALTIKGAWKDSPATAAFNADSLTELVCNHLGIDSFAVPLADAVILAHGGAVRAELGAAVLQITYSLPQK